MMFMDDFITIIHRQYIKIKVIKKSLKEIPYLKKDFPEILKIIVYQN